MRKSCWGTKEFRHDLTAQQYEGHSLWAGRAELSLSEATADERAGFENSAADEEDALKDDDDSGFVMFLVDITEPQGPNDTRD